MGRLIQITGHQIWVEEIGAQPALDHPCLVFLHEGLGSVAMWKDFPQDLCNRTGLPGMFYDRIGHGRSGPLKQKRGKDYLHVEALEYLPRLLTILGIRTPILVGHSDGGTIALIYAAYYPVKALITEAAHIYVEDRSITGIQQAKMNFETAGLRQHLAKYHDAKTDQLFYAWADTWLDPGFRDWNISHLLKRISAPALIIQGDADEYATELHLWDIVNGIGNNATPFVVSGCGHVPHKQASGEVMGVMAGFIKGDLSRFPM